MTRWTLALPFVSSCTPETLAAPWLSRNEVEEVICLHAPDAPPALPLPAGIRALPCEHPDGGTFLAMLLKSCRTEFLALLREPCMAHPAESLFRRASFTARSLGAGLLYSHYREQRGDTTGDVPLPRFQPGSARDTFPTGPFTFFHIPTVRKALEARGPLTPSRWAGHMEVLLCLAREGSVVRIPEYLYTVIRAEGTDAHAAHFAYQAASARPRQIELEQVYTRHLRDMGAWLPTPSTPLAPDSGDFPVEASIIIPVRNRVRTIADAIRSAATQCAPFPFNILVVDNFSTDGTKEQIESCMAQFPHIHHLVPESPGLGIGGCWQLAVTSPLCGRYAVQLDSDDLYSGSDTLSRMVGCLKEGPHAMAVGSYRIVDGNLEELPPGLVDHREWTPENGHNNLLRVEGIGAPRAYHVPTLRQVGFPDVSYGEDYAVALAISRQWTVGRVFDPLYLCRRWEGNSDSGLTAAQQAAHHEYKDHLRSCELGMRMRRHNG